ncbi:hypothetical protein Pst134EB_023995 [Puccinia striiformis f. sp. tritici]|nr:hypothetical protein Pst134EB_023995 [Puccinia striiformis f. sp. tritici]
MSLAYPPPPPRQHIHHRHLVNISTTATSSSSYTLPLPHRLPPPPPPPDQPTALHQPRWLPIVNDHPIDHPAHLLPSEIRLMMTSPSLTPKPTPRTSNSTQPSGATQALTDHKELLKAQKTAHNAVSACYLAYKEPQLSN